METDHYEIFQEFINRLLRLTVNLNSYYTRDNTYLLDELVDMIPFSPNFMGEWDMHVIWLTVETLV